MGLNRRLSRRALRTLNLGRPPSRRSSTELSASTTLCSRGEHFAKILDQLPEPTWLERRLLQGVFRYALQILLNGAKIFARDAEESISELPRGRPGLDAFTKAEIIAEVSRKELRGCTHKQAKMRTARQFNVSVSTVQRAWDDRGNRGEVDFRSVVKFLADEGKLADHPTPQLSDSTPLGFVGPLVAEVAAGPRLADADGHGPAYGDTLTESGRKELWKRIVIFGVV